MPAEALTGRAGDARAAELSEGLAADQDQLDELAVMFGKQEISAREWRAARQSIEQRMRERQRQLSAATGADALRGLPGHGEQLRQHWDALSLTDRRRSSPRCSTTPSSLRDSRAADP